MTDLPTLPSRTRQGVGLVAWVLFSFAATVSAAFGAPDDWYARLEKPPWNPPGWVFGPAWTLLYTLMGIAAWLVWRRGGWSRQRGPLLWFILQWILNALWTPLFFGLHRPGLAFAEILGLLVAIGITLANFWRVSRPAGALLIPYLLWVAFASFLNFTLWRMNPST
jgi:benzodiazapine receptor